MIKFKTDLFAQFLDSGLYKVSRDFPIEFSHSGKNYLLNIPIGTETDLASVPKVFWWLFSKDDRDYLESAIPHDKFYQLGGVVEVVNLSDKKIEKLRISRLRADQLFREGAKELGAGYFKRNTIYWAVRMGGAKSWGSKAPHKKPRVSK